MNVAASLTIIGTMPVVFCQSIGQRRAVASLESCVMLYLYKDSLSLLQIRGAADVIAVPPVP